MELNAGKTGNGNGSHNIQGKILNLQEHRGKIENFKKQAPTGRSFEK
jgi:hypothetical protein